MTTDTGAGYQPDMGTIGVPAAPADGQPPADSAGQAPQGQPASIQSTDPAPHTADPSTPAADPSTEAPKGDRLAALVKERRDGRNEAADLRQTVGQLQQTVAGLSPQTKADAEAWTNPHDAVEAPMDHLRAEIDHLGGVVSQAKQDVGQQLQHQQQQTALADYERGVTMEIGTVAQQVPELAGAHQAVAAHFMRNAQMQGLPPAQAAQQARNAMLGAYLQHQQQGRDAVDATVQMAMAVGYQAQPQPAADILGAPGGQPAPNTQQQIARGQIAAASSLGGATGNAGATAPPDLQSLVRQSRSQLRANDGAGIKRIRALLGGQV